ncbi:hypothetical protein BDP67DRAFT_561499 [Colletotrichum lupini]|nr:hypothetical protein BDP67DRAFT_561499 [Colletotrichum lupini]
MENHFRSFMRVIRKIDDADELIQSFLASEEFILSQNDASPSLAPHDQERLLDFPNAETQAANIAESTKLSKEDLLERAVESPSQLTAAEISLLKNRYCMDISPDEEHEVSRAAGLIMGPNRISEEEYEQAQKRLGAAFANDEEADRYMARRDGVLFHARDAVGAGSSAINNKWKLQKLEWPTSDAAGGGKEMSARQAVGRGDAEEDTSELTIDEDQRGGREDEERLASFRILRTRFKSIRDRGTRSQTQEGIVSGAPVYSETSALEGGIIRNVFLMVDKPSVKSVLGAHRLVDDMWVWAVDPGHDDVDETLTTNDEPRQSETPRRYRGFMRVRLQQLVNNFYDVRRFHQREYTMKELWEAAQKSKHQAFVSIHDVEARIWSIDRFVGSAMRAQPPRIVYGPIPTTSAEKLVHK